MSHTEGRVITYWKPAGNYRLLLAQILKLRDRGLLTIWIVDSIEGRCYEIRTGPDMH